MNETQSLPTGSATSDAAYIYKSRMAENEKLSDAELVAALSKDNECHDEIIRTILEVHKKRGGIQRLLLLDQLTESQT